MIYYTGTFENQKRFTRNHITKANALEIYFHDNYQLSIILFIFLL
jgi:hypothetical protein